MHRARAGQTSPLSVCVMFTHFDLPALLVLQICSKDRHGDQNAARLPH